MLSLARTLSLVVVCFVVVPTLVTTARADVFWGWSADNSYYLRGKTSSSGKQSLLLCLSDAARGSTTWPADILRPSGSCVTLCSESDSTDCHEPERVRALVNVPPAQPTGPHRERITVMNYSGRAELTVTAGLRELAAATMLLDRATSVAFVESAHWRSDGGAVAIVLGSKSTKSRYLALLAWKPPAAPITSKARP